MSPVLSRELSSRVDGAGRRNVMSAPARAVADLVRVAVGDSTTKVGEEPRRVLLDELVAPLEVLHQLPAGAHVRQHVEISRRFYSYFQP